MFSYFSVSTNFTYLSIMVYHGYFGKAVKHYLTKTELRTEIFIQLKLLDNANYSGMDTEIEKRNEND